MTDLYNPKELHKYYSNIHIGYSDNVCICYNITDLRNEFNIIGELVYFTNENIYIFVVDINKPMVKSYRSELPINSYEQLEADLGRVSLRLKKSVLNEVVK